MNAINWFEIPAVDYGRAVAFYEGLLATTLQREDMAGQEIAVFPYEMGGVGGAVVPQGAVAACTQQPGAGGTLVYLNAGTLGAFDAALGRLEGLGGRIVQPKTSLGPIGHIAVIADTEGNRVGLHAPAEA